MPLNVSRYPRNWPKVACDLKDAVDWECQECGQACHRPDQDFLDGVARWEQMLTVAHVEPESQAPDAEVVCVMMLCFRCHNRFDAAMQAERARRYQNRFQLSLGPFWARGPRDLLSAEELAELEGDWPQMPELEGGVDRFAEWGIVGEEAV
jgi:hypothetical protein